jgi:hypothetical protein
VNPSPSLSLYCVLAEGAETVWMAKETGDGWREDISQAMKSPERRKVKDETSH